MTFAIIQKWNPSIHGESPEQLYRPDNKYIVLHTLTYPEYNNKDFGVFSKVLENGEADLAFIEMYEKDNYVLANPIKFL